MLEVDKTNENNGALITTNDEEAVENVRVRFLIKKNTCSQGKN